MQAYSDTFSLRRLWQIFAGSMIVMFGVLLLVGYQIYQAKPPIPSTVVTTDGKTLFTREDILRGQAVWQSMGGMQQGSIWGHGSYVAPDWSADWLHREALAQLDQSAKLEGKAGYGELPLAEQAGLRATLQQQMRANSYDPATDTIRISGERAAAIDQVGQHYSALFTGVTAQARALRNLYAFPAYAMLRPDEAQALNAFFFWTAWAATTNRPGDKITYTSNWPHEPLVGNTPPGSIFLWTFLSILILLAGIGAIVWYYAREFDVWRKDGVPDGGFAQSDLLSAVEITPSMRATSKYFIVVILMFLAQIAAGIVTAHYAVEGQGLYGLPMAEYFPYSVTRTWHTQLAVLWIAAAWLAAGLYIGPLLGKGDPKWQVFGVNVLWGSLLLIVGGSFVGQWLAINRMIPDLTISYWFGTQGYEFLDLGRFWQIYLFIGLVLWVVLMMRALWPVMKVPGGRSLLYLIFIATISIGLLFGAGLAYGQHTHISIMEYWRWWVVHLWVEGVFEVFATAIVSALFVRMGLVRISVATTSVLVATLIFLSGGVLGTFHHLYFSGTPVSVIALGSAFSALEVVPLLVVGFEAYSRAQHSGIGEWEAVYHWCFRFFAAVLFWNLVGAGLLGFLINPPLALYYMQGLNTTATHGHAALFGVYGMLGLGLILFCLRGLTDPARWNTRLLSISFWCLNIGLGMMVFISLLPQGLVQAWTSFTQDYVSARSAAMIHSPVMQALVWARVPGDLVFSVGAVAFAVFLFQTFRGSAKTARGIAPGGPGLAAAE